MDAITLLNQQIDVIKLLEHYDFDIRSTEGAFMRTSCKMHGGDNPTSFVVNVENGLWYCHTNCGGGDAYTLVQKLEDVDFASAVRKVASLFDVDIENLKIQERQADYLRDMKNFINIMKKRSRRKEMHEFHIKEEIKQVSKYRDFKEETLEHFGLGFVSRVELEKKSGEKYSLNNRLVFPIHFKGKQVGLSFRKVKASDYPKWSHQPVSIETSKILYNYDHVLGEPRITISEGITDVWAWYEVGIPAVATFGAHLTEEQYKLLLMSGADLVFAYDGDEAGQIATEKAIKLFKQKANLYTVPFDENEDPESIEREELYERYKKRKRC